MARENDLEWMPQVLGAAELWRDKCFYGDGALFSDDPNEKLWTLDNIQELYDCLKNLQKQKGKYWGKLAIQMKDKAPKIIKLQAEVMWMLRLFPIGKSIESNRHTKILVSTKQSDIRKIMSWGGMSMPDTHLLSEQVLLGVGKPGPYYLNKIVFMQLFFLNLLCDWKALSDQDRDQFKQNNADTAWQFAEYCDQFLEGNLYESSEALPLRHALLFFLYPDYFERIVSWGDKNKITRDYLKRLSDHQYSQFVNAGGFNTPLAVDKAIFEIRVELERGHGIHQLDFYVGVLKDTWNKNDNKTPSKKQLKSRGMASKAPTNSKQNQTNENEPQSADEMLDALIDKDKLIAKAPECKKKLLTHYVKERSASLRNEKIKQFESKLYCEACGTDAKQNPKYHEEYCERIFEVHHKIPLADIDIETEMSVNDLALLCANCHRAIHATNPLLSVEEFKNSIT
jgi:hypothetical protein